MTLASGALSPTVSKGPVSRAVHAAPALDGLVPYVALRHGRIEAMSAPMREVLGLTSPYQDSTGQEFASIVVPSERAGVENFCTTLALCGGRAQHRCHLADAQGMPIPVVLHGAQLGADEESFLVLTVTDLSPWVQDDNGVALNNFAAAFDTVTGLATRGLLLDRTAIALKAARRHRRRAALLHVHVPGLAHVLHQLAPEVADEFQVAVADVLRSTARDSDTMARLGPEDFVVMLPEIRQRDDAGIIAARLVQGLATHFIREGGARALTAHVGVAVYPTDGTTAERLIAGAESALRRALETADGGFALAEATYAEIGAIAPLEFQDDYLVGNAEIDEEHRRLVELTNRLVHELNRGTDVVRMGGEMHDVIDILTAHLDGECQQLAASPYETSVEELANNRRFLDELHCILFHVNGPAVAVAVDHLHDWLHAHLRGAPRSLALSR